MNRPMGFPYVPRVVVAGFAAPSLGPEPRNSVRFSAFSDHQIGTALVCVTAARPSGPGYRYEPVRSSHWLPHGFVSLGRSSPKMFGLSTNTVLSEIAHGWA